MKTGTRPIKLEIPSSFEELTAIGMGHDPVRRLVQQMVIESCCGLIEEEPAQEESAGPFGPPGVTLKAADATGQTATESH